MATFGPNAEGVSYIITENTVFGLPAGNSNITITDSSGNTQTISNVPDSNIVTTSGGSVSILSVGLGSTYVIPPGLTGTITILAALPSLSDNVISVGGNATISTGATLLSGTTINVTGGTATLANGIIGDALSGTTVNLTDGGSFSNGSTLISVLGGTTVNFGSGGGTFVANAGGAILDLSGTTITGFDANNGEDNIQFTNLAGTAATYTVATSGENQIVSVIGSDGTTLATATISGTSIPTGSFTLGQPGPLSITQTGTTITVGNSAAVCFLAGTRMRTPIGEVEVEMLQPGDAVIACIKGEEAVRPVKWIGRRRISLAAHPSPALAAPIRILRGAFADDMPHRDLLVSPDHAIFVDGMLIAVRQLVNGATIRQELSRAAATYFHVELDRHAIIFAEGLPTESYLDTENRGFFSNAGGRAALHANLSGDDDFSVRKSASCAPFVRDETRVKPVWEYLAQRASVQGYAVSTASATTDAELHVVANGKLVWPVSVANGKHCFTVASDAMEVRLVSRAASPTDTRPWLEDRRRLGICVERIVVRTEDHWQEIPVDHPGLTVGWWMTERSRVSLRRWTDGNAVLPLPVTAKVKMLDIHATSRGMSYPTNAAAVRRLVA